MTKHITDDMVISYQVGDLSMEEQAFVENHITQCDSCSLLFNEWNELQHAWENPDDALYSDDFTKKVMFSIEEDKKKNTTDSIPFIRNKKYSRLTTFVHFSAAAAATYLFMHYGIFNEIETLSSNLVIALDHTASQVGRFTSEGVSIFNSLDVNEIFRSLK